jgi:hypothetical protein
MELRLTRIFNPLSKAAGFFLSELGVTPTKVSLTSFAAAVFSASLFIFSFNIPLISPRTILTLAVALIFLNAFLDSVERRIEVRRKKKSVFGGPLGTFLGQLSDVFILFGALIFLSSRDTYYNFGKFLFINLSYVEPGTTGHIGLGVMALMGILILRHLVKGKKEKGIGLWTRSERMYIFGVFGALGIFTGLFSGLMFSGVLVLNLLIYVSFFRILLNLKGPTLKSSRVPYRTRRMGKTALFTLFGFIETVLKSVLRVIGVILLGVYLTSEKIYLAFAKFFGSLKKVKFPKKVSGPQYAYKHPPIQPFEGTISPPASSLPAESDEAYQSTSPIEVEEDHQEGEEKIMFSHLRDKQEGSSKKEEPTIELPPPQRLMESDTTYSGEEVGESMLVLFGPTSKKEDALIDIVEFMVSEGKDVVIVSTQPGTTHYSDRLKGVQGIQVVELTEQSALPTKDAIPMTNLEYFSEIFDDLTPQHIFIFEPLTNLILHSGVSQAYRFISQTLTRLTKLGVTFIVFMNKSGHDKIDISNFENLFLNIAVIEDSKLKKVA